MAKDDTIHTAALRLREAGETGQPCAPVRDLFAEGNLTAAYAVQACNREHWLKAGRRIVGRKVAFSARAAQRAMNLKEPAWGTLYADMLMGDGDEVAFGRVMQPRLEGEVAILLDRDLTMEHPTLADIYRAVAYCLPAIEIVGCRIASLDAKPVDLVADNAGGGAFVLGSPARRLDGLDLRRLTMTMTKNGEPVAKGSGEMVYGNPLHALAWLAGRMVQDEMPLKAGDVIMTGTFFAMLPASPGDQIEVNAEGLGRCAVSFAAA
jgi:2-keto-4-pentenoate hydratase